MLLSVGDGSLWPLSEPLAAALEQAFLHHDSERAAHLIAAFGIPTSHAAARPPESVPLRALSLAVAQTCNLGCGYCYAQQGTFGAAAEAMPIEVARSAVDRLVGGAPPGARVTLAFLGGEPFANRAVLRDATRFAADRAATRGVQIAFSVTTNATLLTAEDCAFLDEHAFAVTISIDGLRHAHDRLRPFASGRNSYDRVVEGARRLLDRSPRRCGVTARVSVTPTNLELPAALESLVELGFDMVQFTPVLASPTGSHELAADGLAELLAQMIACGRVFEQRLREDRVYPFLNLISTLQQIDLASPNTYPCGAGGNYLAASSRGDLSACHRFVGDVRGALGNVSAGVDSTSQRRWFAERSVLAQEPCRTCWARHLCGGSCHFDVLQRGRPACDYIRGWLHYSLGVYARLASESPELLRRALAPPGH